MIKCVKRDRLDVKKWDACVKSSPHARLYAMSYYLDAVCTEGTWAALVYKDYEAVMPLPINQRIPFFPRIMLPHFAQQLGVFSPEGLLPELMTQFIAAIPQSYKSVYLQLNDGNSLKHFPNAEVRNRKNYVLSLQQDHETLFKNYSANLRKNVRKAGKKNLSLHHISAEEFIPFYLVHDKSKYTSKSRILDVLGELLPTLLDKNEATLYGVRDEEHTLLGACLITAFQKRLTYMMANSSPDGRGKGAMHWLLDQIIKEHCMSMNYFDFEGSDIPSIAEFFSFFGTEIIPYPLVQYNRFPFSLIS